MSPDLDDQLDARALADLRAYVCDSAGDYSDSDLVRGAIDLWSADVHAWPEPVSLELQSLGFVQVCGSETHLVLTGHECERCIESESDEQRGPCGIRADGEAA